MNEDTESIILEIAKLGVIQERMLLIVASIYAELRVNSKEIGAILQNQGIAPERIQKEYKAAMDAETETIKKMLRSTLQECNTPPPGDTSYWDRPHPEEDE
jgi:hypothetical protein